MAAREVLKPTARQLQHCRRCGKSGHNKRTCKRKPRRGRR